MSHEKPEENEDMPEIDLDRLAEAIAPQRPTPDRAAHMKAQIMARIQAAPQAQVSVPAARPEALALYTLRSDEREWKQVSRGVEMCVLHQDEHSRSVLLRMQPDSFLLPHQHWMSEESLILEGDALIGDDLHLSAGDFHFSPAGTKHPLLQSPSGCIVYVRGEKRFRPRPSLGLFKRILRGKTPPTS